MSFLTKYRNISWSQFETCNQDPQTAFEKMCRLLFNRYFFNNRALLHSNPNNPGIEVEPILEPQSKKRISFQSKYFSSTDYAQIKHSAEQAVKCYAGRLDILYLYCNKDLTITSKPYKDIETILNENNIKLVPINNQTILDQVICNSVISSLYFNHHGITNDWFNEHLKISLDSLGPRYNNQFNVDTKTEEYIDLFSQNDESIASINQKKFNAIKEIEENRWKYRRYDEFIDKIYSAINSLNDITTDNISQCLGWSDAVRKTLSNEILTLNEKINNKKNALASSTGVLGKEKQIEIEREIRELQYLVECPLLLEFDEIERNLLQRKLLIVQGTAGVGKSQLFANAAEKNLRSNGLALLLLGNSYLSNDQIALQILSHLGLNFGIDEFFNILEGIGEERHQCVTVFIDAINESGNKVIWKTGLAQLISRLDKLNYVRLAVSIRAGYESLVFDETVQKKIQSGEIVKLVHAGFQEESIEATKIFLNYYNIPFSPSYFLQHEMTNPLFLTLFCKTYTGEDFDIFTLFERIIEKTDKEAQKVVGLDGSLDVLKHLVYEIAELQLYQAKKVITKKELFELNFWNTYGLSNSKIPFIATLERSGLLVSYIYDKTESYFLGYNLLEDFVCAKLIMEKHPEKETLKSYLQKELLEIKNGEITNHTNRDIFIVVCGLYAEKYNEECIDIIDNLKELHKYHIIESYIDSFLWRKSSAVDGDAFIRFLNKYKVDADKVWRIFIENSTKPNHPLNAEKLHAVLLKKTIHHRDYLWTTYINGFTNEEERLFQLIDSFDKGNILGGMTNDNIKLLLILFSWLLTSSNRFLRDKASKAMIELLKSNLQMCKILLESFKSVNDPYVIQRLYGVVFGACMKRTQRNELEFKELSEYVFDTIFNKDAIYPDVLLRDYASLILERCLYEFPDTISIIDTTKIRPPYRSTEIPIMKKEDYYRKNQRNSGFNSIVQSMYPDGIDGPGMYGDFGRYVFEVAVSNFEKIDIENLYHYAMQFIRDELGYDDELFGEYDTSTKNYYYDRHQTKKVERIGKKYQWIALYNILAKISDTQLLKQWNDEPHQFEGAWEPYVRDFDPTLNCNFLMPPDIPRFHLVDNTFDEFLTGTSNNESEITEWGKATCTFFDSHADKLMFKDASGQTWILLNQHETVKNKHYMRDLNSIGFARGSQQMWTMSLGYIVKQAEFALFKKELEGKNFMGRWFPEGVGFYQLFNREYAWSPSYQSFLSDAWLDYEVETDKKIITKHTGLIPNLWSLEHMESDDFDTFLSLKEQDWEETEIIKRTIGRMLPAHSRIVWEEQYDSSQEETTAFDVPCKDIIDYLQLAQKEYDGYFYSEDGTLVAFDGNLANSCDGVLIRKDYLDKYLHENDLRLFWTCLGEKQYFCEEGKQIWSEWSGFLYLEDDSIIGIMENKQNNH